MEPGDPPKPSRRRLLAGALAAGGLVAGRAGAAENPANLPPNVPDHTRKLGAGVAAKPYGQPSKHEGEVIRRTIDWLTPAKESSVSFTPLHQLAGTITPNGLCFERHHGGVPDMAPDDYRLMLHGLVERPLQFTLADLKRFPRISRVNFCECAANGGMEWKAPQMIGCQFTHGMIHNVEYTGVPLRLLLNEAGLKPAAKWLLLEGADAAAMSRSLPLDKALDDVLIATHMNGEALRPENGYPARIVVPGWEGNLWIKWLRRIEVGDQPWQQREETSKYTDLLPDGRARRFTFVMDAKSVITTPSPQAPIRHGKGFTVISGLAWSGRGRIARVDVSLDGGRNWAPAKLDGLPGDKAVSRFHFEFDWDGRELFLQSRAIDETGYVQPSRAALKAIRGVNSTYHNNAIWTWRVAPSGEVENVEIG